ncbi:probable NCS6-protein required for thiolation of uridine at wobble positions [Ustilago bromivora]|uniref:Cytoplasmic tRNA 2-thiolation protein 1 n=1 Tax=Ustilago bromivora TaxID=307758 RepID=A0A1K0G8D8_9BASI|nr:probable NCS6-protein required for thiolation of uridine at wobble positions [Ustilago bromivora]SYW84334.1 probable NCS6 - protein required for thiolation of uridine at wobble positions [Ustilago bromivora]
MAPKLCVICNAERAVLRRPKTAQQICKECFFYVFETEVHYTIVSSNLFKRGDRVAIGASGGKDSTVLAHCMKVLNERYDYGLDLFLLSIDEGITGYRDDSLETVKRNQQQYQLPLKVLGYGELYGWTMDDIVRSVGRKNNCTFCGVFRRQALDRGAAALGVDHIVTGHNADDVSETVLMNVLRGDIARLERCTEIVTKGPSDGLEDPEHEGCGSSGSNNLGVGGSGILRSKPFMYAYEKEIVMYAYFKKLDYFSTECIYSPNAYRGYARTFLKDLEAIRPSSIVDIIQSGQNLKISTVVKQSKKTELQNCARCGYISSNKTCKACILLEGLEKGTPQLGIGSEKSRKIKDIRQEMASKDANGAKTEVVAVAGQQKTERRIPQWTGVAKDAPPISSLPFVPPQQRKVDLSF